MLSNFLSARRFKAEWRNGLRQDFREKGRHFREKAIAFDICT
jgi:hypothetical protein